MVNYIDSNVFIFAALDNGKKGIKAKEILRRIILGELKAVTSSLTIDEFVWKVWKETKDRFLAIEEGLKILEFDNLEIISIHNHIIKNALTLMKKHNNLKPRDAIHLAAALSYDAEIIISDDSDFNNLEEIKRKSLD